MMNFKRRMTALGETITIMSLAVLLALACGGGESASELTLGAYFQELSTAIDERDTQGDQIDVSELDLFGDEDEALRAARETFNVGLGVWNDFVDRLADIVAPAVVATEHRELVGAAEGVSQDLAVVSEELGQARSLDELLDLLFASGPTAAGAQFNDACVSLQRIAVEDSIGVDLHCSDEAMADDGTRNAQDATHGGDNGGGDLTLDEYFQRVEELGQAFDAALEALDEQAGIDFEATDTEEAAIELIAGFVDDIRSLTDDLVADLDGIDPPVEAADSHEEIVSASRELVDVFDNAIMVIDTAETFDEATLALDGPGVTDAQNRVGAACVALQDLADSNSIDVDLRCPNG